MCCGVARPERAIEPLRGTAEGGSDGTDVRSPGNMFNLLGRNIMPGVWVSGGRTWMRALCG